MNPFTWVSLLRRILDWCLSLPWRVLDWCLSWLPDLSSNEWAILAWTFLALVGFIYCLVMVTRRIRSYLELMSWEAEEVEDYDYRVFLAWQDIRRSLGRLASFASGLFVGALFVIIRHTDWIERPPLWLMRHWVWLLAALMFFTTLNEMADARALSHLRRMHRERAQQ